MRTAAKHLYRTILVAHMEALGYIQTERASTMNDPTNLADLADLCLVIKQAQDLVKELQTQLNKCLELSSQLICAQWTQQEMSEPIRTPYTTCIPHIKMMVKFPNKKHQPEEYKKFCEHFGVSEELINSGAMQPHWPSMIEYITGLMEQGFPPPPGCDPTSLYPVYSVTSRKNQEILDAKDLPDKRI